MQQGFSCPTTAFNAFLASLDTPNALVWIALNAYVSVQPPQGEVGQLGLNSQGRAPAHSTHPQFVSCHAYVQAELHFTDLFTNVITGETRWGPYTYEGKLTEASTMSCYAWQLGGCECPPAVGGLVLVVPCVHVGMRAMRANEMLCADRSTTLENTAWTTALSTTMDKPYDSGAPPGSTHAHVSPPKQCHTTRSSVSASHRNPRHRPLLAQCRRTRCAWRRTCPAAARAPTPATAPARGRGGLRGHTP